MFPVIGYPAPFFSAQALYGKDEVKSIKLEDFKGQYLVLLFYPLNFTSVCSSEMLQFRDELSKFQKAGTQVLGISVDSIPSHKKWLSEIGEIGFPLVSDLARNISRDYGTLSVEKGYSQRSSFIIDPDGTLKYLCLHSSEIGRDANEVYRILAALQTRESCPAGWKPGSATLSKK